MSYLTKSTKALQFYDYLFNNKELYNNEKNYYFWIIDIEDEKDINKALEFFEEMVFDPIFIEYKGKFLMFYFIEIDFELENIIHSIIDDFSFNIKIYASSKMEIENRSDFFLIYDLYNKYLAHKTNPYFNNVDLVNEIISVNINDIKLIKPIILRRIIDDPQMEILIQAMFKNNLNVTQTASDVYMHRNTVIKKLDFIKKETGLNLQKFQDANIMYWILKIR